MENASLSFDKRRNPRVRITLPVQYKVVSQTEEAVTIIEQRKNVQVGDSKNVSAEGLYLICDRALIKGDIIKIDLQLPNTAKPLRAFCEVMWISDHDVPAGKYGAGLCFMGLRVEDADAISKFIAESLQDEADVWRETTN